MNAEQVIAGAEANAVDLGKPLPDAPHALSMALPRWEHVIGYEEKAPEVTQQLMTGYPRFVVHRLVAELSEWLVAGRFCLPFPSSKVAETGARFVQRRCGEAAQIVCRDGLNGVAVSTPEGESALKEFWQHAGLIVSSRQAAAIVEGNYEAPDPAVYERLRGRLAEIYNCSPDDIFLAPSGMAAQYAALRATMLRSPGLPTAQLGFPYVDTFKLQQKFGAGAVMLHDLASIPNRLKELLQTQALAGCFCEIPGNPLLGSVDLRQVTPLLRERRIPLVVDDVIATPYNIDLSEHADLIATSLTKFITGRGDVMAGALVCNPKSPLYQELRGIISREHEELLWWEEAALVEELARDFPQRMALHNAQGLAIAERLKQHPGVEHVWYPKWECSEAYNAVRRPHGGWGALVTFLPRNAAVAAPEVYNRLPLCKGPSLGTVFTLACPFTLLAHYAELDWAESCGVPRNLIRLSIGLENLDGLWARIRNSL